MVGQTVPLDIVGSNKFGRYPGVSSEETINLFISDNTLLNYAGYKKHLDLGKGVARGMHVSNRANIMIMVVNETVYKISSALVTNVIGTLSTFTSDVYIAENNANQIAICDGKDIYIYNDTTGAFSIAMTGSSALDFRPGYVTYMNEYFIAADTRRIDTGAEWRLSEVRDGRNWPNDAQHVGKLSTKPDITQAVVRAPGKGNLLYVMGENVTELWVDVGNELFPFVRSTTQSIDYGCANANTIAITDNVMCWLGQNENSGPVILYSNGGEIQQVSDDGINFKLANLNNSNKAVGMFFKQDGHLFYQITFYDTSDNFTVCYDFTTGLSYTLMNEVRDAHIARKMVYFDNTYYFCSYKDNSLYEQHSKYTTFYYDGNNDYIIPRIRVTKPFKLPNAQPFIANTVQVSMEQGTDINNNQLLSYSPTIMLSLSRNNGQSYGTKVPRDLNTVGKYENRVTWTQLGRANNMCFQFQINTRSRVVINNATLEWYS